MEEIPNNHLRCLKTPVNNGILIQTTNLNWFSRRISEPSTVYHSQQVLTKLHLVCVSAWLNINPEDLYGTLITYNRYSKLMIEMNHESTTQRMVRNHTNSFCLFGAKASSEFIGKWMIMHLYHMPQDSCKVSILGHPNARRSSSDEALSRTNWTNQTLICSMYGIFTQICHKYICRM